jgi:hypothetical protein
VAGNERGRLLCVACTRQRGVPQREGYGRPFVRMYLTDSSGIHAGRCAVWPVAEPHAEMLTQRPAGWIVGPQPSADKSKTAEGVAVPMLCVWNSAKQLGRSHWEADTVLHIEILTEVRPWVAPAKRAPTPPPHNRTLWLCALWLCACDV